MTANRIEVATTKHSRRLRRTVRCCSVKGQIQAYPVLGHMCNDFAFECAYSRLRHRATRNAASAPSSAPTWSCATRHAAVDHEFRTRHVVRSVGGEEQHAICDVLSLSSPAERH